MKLGMFCFVSFIIGEAHQIAIHHYDWSATTALMSGLVVGFVVMFVALMMSNERSIGGE